MLKSEYIRRLERLHTESFRKNTELSWHSDSGVLLHRPKSNVFATEFLCGQLGSLLIHGDGPDLLIRTYRDTSLLSKISLLAESNYDYITEKVVIGNAEEFSLDVFQQEIEDDIERYTKDEDASTELVSSLKKLRLKTECEMSFRNAVWDYYPDPSDCPNYGTVPSNNLIMAKVAAKRVLELYTALLGSPRTLQTIVTQNNRL